jgi:hypothetical protein
MMENLDTNNTGRSPLGGSQESTIIELEPPHINLTHVGGEGHKKEADVSTEV